MRFYTEQHRFYCGIDLHARSMYLCILHRDGNVLLHKNLRANPDAFLKAVAKYRQDLVIAVECMFTWYWLADLYEIHDMKGQTYVQVPASSKLSSDLSRRSLRAGTRRLQFRQTCHCAFSTGRGGVGDW